MKRKSILSFFEIADSALDGVDVGNHADFYEQMMRRYATDVTCKNVFCIDVPVAKLVGQISNPACCNKVLVNDIAAELEYGSNYMFVKPIEGPAVFGMNIRDFLDKAAQKGMAETVKTQPIASSAKPIKALKSKYFDIDSWGLAGGDVPPRWAYNYLSKNGYLATFQIVVKSGRHEFLPDYREKSQDLKLDCLMFNKRGQLAFKWNSEQDKMAFILKWS